MVYRCSSQPGGEVGVTGWWQQMMDATGWIAQFLTEITTEYPYTLQWDARSLPPPKNIASSHRDLNPHLTHGSLSQPESSTKTASRSVQPFLQGSLVWQTDRQTDRPRYSVG